VRRELRGLLPIISTLDEPASSELDPTLQPAALRVQVVTYRMIRRTT
jgi:hypothetical protein